MLDAIGEANAAAMVGLFGGILLGLAARLGRFCTLGAIEDYFYGGSGDRLRMWGLAIGLSVIGSAALASMGLFDPTQSIYLAISWSPAASVFGGLLFGYGMALAGNCGYGALARAGGGDIRSAVVVLVMGLASYATISGPLARLRVFIFPPDIAPDTPASIPHGLSSYLGLSANSASFAIGLGIVLIALSGKSFRRSPAKVCAAALVALAVISAWAGTSYIHANGFDERPVVSHTFSAPVGETLLYAMTSTGQTLSFGIGSVVGVLFGAFLGSLWKGHFRWEACEDPRELRRQLAGATLMGVGAVVALGCSIGQGLSAFSVLAYSAPITFLAIFAGASLGLRQLIVGFDAAT